MVLPFRSCCAVGAQRHPSFPPMESPIVPEAISAPLAGQGPAGTRWVGLDGEIAGVELVGDVEPGERDAVGPILR